MPIFIIIKNIITIWFPVIQQTENDVYYKICYRVAILITRLKLKRVAILLWNDSAHWVLNDLEWCLKNISTIGTIYVILNNSYILVQ